MTSAKSFAWKHKSKKRKFFDVFAKIFSFKINKRITFTIKIFLALPSKDFDKTSWSEARRSFITLTYLLNKL